jgi:hypothetical protein
MSIRLTARRREVRWVRRLRYSRFHWLSLVQMIVAAPAAGRRSGERLRTSTVPGLAYAQSTTVREVSTSQPRKVLSDLS